MSSNDKKYFVSGIEQLFNQYKILSPSSSQTNSAQFQKHDQFSLIEKAEMKKRPLPSSTNEFSN
jgi:hypothetical protein